MYCATMHYECIMNSFSAPAVSKYTTQEKKLFACAKAFPVMPRAHVTRDRNNAHNLIQIVILRGDRKKCCTVHRHRWSPNMSSAPFLCITLTNQQIWQIYVKMIFNGTCKVVDFSNSVSTTVLQFTLIK